MKNKFISIILPIRNEEKYIEKTLNSIFNQTYPIKLYEVIISDGMSNDNTYKIITKFSKNYKNIKIIKNPFKIVPHGLNLSLNESKGDVIVRIDGHTIIDKFYLENCVKLLYEKKAHNVGGLINPIKHNGKSSLIGIATSSKFGIGNSPFHYSLKGNWVDTVYLGAWDRKVFQEIGGFDEELKRNQDDEFNFRMIQNKFKIWLDPSIKSSYHSRNSFLKLFKQYFQYGFYKVRVFQKRRGFTSYRHLIPAIFILSLFSSAFIYFYNKQIILFLAILCSYLLMSFGFSIYNLVKEKKINILILPFIYFILHSSYGLGTISGLIFFINKWNNYELKDSLFNKKKFLVNDRK